MEEVDALVVGGGPAGLAAATWLGRYRRLVVVADAGDHRSDRVDVSHGYLGRDPQCPGDLLSTGRAEALAYPTVRLVEERVAAIEHQDAGQTHRPRFRATLGTGRLLAHRVVLACGVRDTLPPITGVEEHFGASVFHCPACDGYDAHDTHVVVVGRNEHLAGFVAHLLGWAASVTVVAPPQESALTRTWGTSEDAGGVTRPLDALGVEVVEEEPTAFLGPRGSLRALRTASGRDLPCTTVFLAMPHRPRNHLASALGCDLDEDGHVRVDASGRTSVPGVYAAGDLVPGLQLVSVAAAGGVVAGVSCARSFFGAPVAPAAPPPAPAIPDRR